MAKSPPAAAQRPEQVGVGVGGDVPLMALASTMSKAVTLSATQP